MVAPAAKTERECCCGNEQHDRYDHRYFGKCYQHRLPGEPAKYIANNKYHTGYEQYTHQDQ